MCIRDRSWLALNVNVSLALFEDPVNGRQPKAGSFVRPFGCEEGLEDMRQRLLVHSASCVLDENLDEGAHSRARVKANEVFVEINAV